jgi:hypothetical protein
LEVELTESFYFDYMFKPDATFYQAKELAHQRFGKRNIKQSENKELILAV